MKEIVVIDSSLMRGKKPDIEPLYKGLGVIAGGAIRRWFTGEPQNSDIDIFAFNESSLELINQAYNSRYKGINTGNAITYNGNIQVIRVLTGTVAELFDKFDFAHCCFAYDGELIYTTPKAIISSLRKHLMINNLNPLFAMDSLRRMFKYQRQGYTPCNGTLIDISLAIQSLTSEQIVNQVIISPGGGKRILRID